MQMMIDLLRKKNRLKKLVRISYRIG